MNDTFTHSLYNQVELSYQRRPHPRSRTLSLCSATSSSGSSAYGWNSSAPTAAILTPSPQAMSGLDEHSELAWGAFASSSAQNSGLGASHTLLRFANAPFRPNPSFPTKAGTRPAGQHTAPAYEKKRQERRQSPISKSVTFNLPPPPFSAIEQDSDRSRSPLSPPLKNIPAFKRPVGLAPPSSNSSSTSSSASSSRSPSPGRDSRDTSDDEYTGALDTGLHPVLARVERSSKLCVSKLACATCSKTGRDFPACGKCGKMWCSRECRLQGGKRHVC